MILKIVSGILGVAGLCWLVLLFSSRAILVSERVEDATLHQQLVCTYFNGSGTMQKEYWYSKSDTLRPRRLPALGNRARGRVTGAATRLTDPWEDR